jgi:protocatechuate 3,4-dioxygenase beta subunit
MLTETFGPNRMPWSRPQTIAVVLTGLLSSTVPADAQAQNCCAAALAPCAAYWDAEVVFVGRVEAIKRSGTSRIVSFTVLEGFRGVDSSTVDVATALPGQSCSLSFAVGQEYFVFTERADSIGASRPGSLTTGSCSRTRRVEDAGADLAYARELKQGGAPTGYISGQVVVTRRDLAGRMTGVGMPAPGITVTITSDGATDTVVTDAAGAFRVESRGPGSYRVSSDVPDRFYSDDPESLVTLRDPRSCAHVGAVLHDNGQIAGRVVDAAGRPVAGLTIELGAVGSTGSASTKPDGRSRAGRRTVTGRDGRYTLARLPRGHFVLSVPGVPSGAAPGRPTRVYYPGVETLAASTRLTLASGERANLPDLRIPPRHRFLAVSGVVFDTSGRPAEGARVYLKGAGDGDRIVSEPVIADFMGAFVIAARAGVEFQLFAERVRPESGSSRVDSSDPVQFTAGDGLKPMRLTLERRY